GADIAIDYNIDNVTSYILEDTLNEGVDLILNTISADEATNDLARLAYSGQLAHIAGAPNLAHIEPFTLSPSIHEVALGAAYSAGSIRSRENLSFIANELMKRVKNRT